MSTARTLMKQILASDSQRIDSDPVVSGVETTLYKWAIGETRYQCLDYISDRESKINPYNYYYPVGAGSVQRIADKWKRKSPT